MLQNTHILTLGVSKADKICKIQENICKRGVDFIKTALN